MTPEEFGAQLEQGTRLPETGCEFRAASGSPEQTQLPSCTSVFRGG